jgi:uncharacterized protein (TIGR02001 family)
MLPKFGKLALVIVALAWPSAAGAIDVSGEVGLVSDYRFRGISLSDRQPAVQASLEVEHDSGIYFGTWGSTIKEPGTKLDVEIDLYAGYEWALTNAIALDLSATYYAYPGDWDANYVETTAIARVTSGNASAGLGFSYVPHQSGTRDEFGRHRSRYVYAEASYEMPGTPLKLISTIGHERGYFDEVEGGGKWDWAIGTEIAVSTVRAGVTYVGTGAAGHDDCLVASLFLGF